MNHLPSLRVALMTSVVMRHRVRSVLGRSGELMLLSRARNRSPMVVVEMVVLGMSVHEVLLTVDRLVGRVVRFTHIPMAIRQTNMTPSPARLARTRPESDQIGHEQDRQYAASKASVVSQDVCNLCMYEQRFLRQASRSYAYV